MSWVQIWRFSWVVVFCTLKHLIIDIEMMRASGRRNDIKEYGILRTA